jgi:thymidylate synthase (FAD)
MGLEKGAVPITAIMPHCEFPDGPINGADILLRLERRARTCYKSEGKIKPGSDITLIKKILKLGHISIFDHIQLSVKAIYDRSASHQQVRHRVGAAYAQESQRYCNYDNRGLQIIYNKETCMGVSLDEINEFIIDSYHEFTQSNSYALSNYPMRKKGKEWPKRLIYWLEAIFVANMKYKALIGEKVKAEDARSVLPNATKTEVDITYDLTEWRHVFRDRALNQFAQWQIRGCMQQALVWFACQLPIVFDDLVMELMGKPDLVEPLFINDAWLVQMFEHANVHPETVKIAF